jgi:hypothetical protein
MSERIRGVFDAGEPVLGAMVTKLTERLGADGFRAAYARGTEVPRAEALRRLHELSEQTVVS